MIQVQVVKPYKVVSWKKEAVKDGRMEEFMKTTTNFRTMRMVQLALNILMKGVF